MTLVVEDPGCGWISANHVEHWRVKARRVKAWRAAAYHAALSLTDQYQRAHVTMTVHKKNRARFDVGNLQPTAKAVLDGLVDAHLFPDDDNAHVVGPDLRAGDPVTRSDTPHLTITIEEIP